MRPHRRTDPIVKCSKTHTIEHARLHLHVGHQSGIVEFTRGGVHPIRDITY